MRLSTSYNNQGLFDSAETGCLRIYMMKRPIAAEIEIISEQQFALKVEHLTKILSI